MVNVTKENFIEQSNDLIRHLPTASFISIDEEMTGISIPDKQQQQQQRPKKDEPPSWRYIHSMKPVPERYSIIQLGICLFHPKENPNNNNKNNKNKTKQGKDNKNNKKMSAAGRRKNDDIEVTTKSTEWNVRKYNFYMFPSGEPMPSSHKNHNNNNKKSTTTTSTSTSCDMSPREVVLNPYAVSFLNKHNMNFDLWTKSGIPYQTSDQVQHGTIPKYVDQMFHDFFDAEQHKQQQQQSQGSTTATPNNSHHQQQQQQPTIRDVIRRRVELRRNDDIDFYARAMAGLREWLDAAHDDDHDHDQDENQDVVHDHYHNNNSNNNIVNAGGGGGSRGMIIRDNNGGDGGGSNDTTNNNNNNAAMIIGSSRGRGRGDTMRLRSTIVPRMMIVPTESTSFLLPPCNSFLRRAFYESISKEYPSLDMEPAGELYPDQIRVWRLHPHEKCIRIQMLQQRSWEDLLCKNIGMYRIFTALSAVCNGYDIDHTSILHATSFDQINWTQYKQQRYYNNMNNMNNKQPNQSRKSSRGGGGHDDTNDDEEVLSQNADTDDDYADQRRNRPRQHRRRIPLIVHNGLYDLLFLLTHFHGNGILPNTLSECKQIIGQYFPVIYDTKVMSTEYTIRWNNEMSNLSNLYQRVVVDDEHNNSGNEEDEDDQHQHDIEDDNEHEHGGRQERRIDHGPLVRRIHVLPPVTTAITAAAATRPLRSRTTVTTTTGNAVVEADEEDDNDQGNNNNNNNDDEDVNINNQDTIAPGVGCNNATGGQLRILDQEHEAAYDAFMTGSVYLGLCRHIEDIMDQSIRQQILGQQQQQQQQQIGNTTSNNNNNKNNNNKKKRSSMNNTTNNNNGNGCDLMHHLVEYGETNDNEQEFDHDDYDDDDDDNKNNATTGAADAASAVAIVRQSYGRNLLYQMGMYTVDLERTTKNNNQNNNQNNNDDDYYGDDDDDDDDVIGTTDDPLSRGMKPELTWRVSDIDPSVSTRDIVRCLSNLNDSNGQRVNFEIVWIDDTTFVVATSRANRLLQPQLQHQQSQISRRGRSERSSSRSRSQSNCGDDNNNSDHNDDDQQDDDDDDDDDDENNNVVDKILAEHGRLILRALQARFQKETIVSLSDHLKRQQLAKQQQQYNRNTKKDNNGDDDDDDDEDYDDSDSDDEEEGDEDDSDDEESKCQQASSSLFSRLYRNIFGSWNNDDDNNTSKTTNDKKSGGNHHHLGSRKSSSLNTPRGGNNSSNIVQPATKRQRIR